MWYVNLYVNYFIEKALIIYQMWVKFVAVYSDLIQYDFVYDEAKCLTTIL